MFESIPHGGKLVNRILQGEEREAARARAKDFKKIALTDVGISDLEMIANGAMSPLKGFMGRDDYQSVISNMRLKNGQIWSLPVALPVAKELASSIKAGEQVALVEAPSQYSNSPLIIGWGSGIDKMFVLAIPWQPLASVTVRL